MKDKKFISKNNKNELVVEDIELFYGRGNERSIRFYDNEKAPLLEIGKCYELTLTDSKHGPDIKEVRKRLEILSEAARGLSDMKAKAFLEYGYALEEFLEYLISPFAENERIKMRASQLIKLIKGV